MREIQQSYTNDNQAQEAIMECITYPYNISYFSYHDGLLKFKGRLYVGSTGGLRKHIMDYMHCSGYGGHSEINATFQRFKATFWWPGLKQELQNLITACPQCQTSNMKALESHDSFNLYLFPVELGSTSSWTSLNNFLHHMARTQFG